MMNTMTKFLATVTLLSSAGAPFLQQIAFAKKVCTDQPKEKWMSEADFKKKVEAEGYTIKKFKQPGSCYEIYGTDKAGKNIEIYFNPVDGSVVKREDKK